MKRKGEILGGKKENEMGGREISRFMGNERRKWKSQVDIVIGEKGWKRMEMGGGAE